MTVADYTSPAKRLRFVIIGAGMAGLLAAIRLKERGDGDFVIYEKGDKVGGTWRENTYPGLSCDTPAHSYTYSFAPNPDWSAYYAPGPEIREYFERVTEQYRLRDYIRLVSRSRAADMAKAAGRSARKTVRSILPILSCQPPECYTTPTCLTYPA
jgi:cation diffusion facilitator CzcD-associated flavoprotein CzcO